MKMYLIVVKGLQATGKTPLSRWIEHEFKFTRVSADDIGAERYGKPSHRSNPARFSSQNPEHRKFVIEKSRDVRDALLLRRNNVVIDAGVGTYEDYLLFSREFQESLKEQGVTVERFLIILRADFEERVRRSLKKRRYYTEEEIREMFSISEKKWKEPMGLPTDVQVLDFENNAMKQFEEIKTHLLRVFGSLRRHVMRRWVSLLVKSVKSHLRRRAVQA